MKFINKKIKKILILSCILIVIIIVGYYVYGFYQFAKEERTDAQRRIKDTVKEKKDKIDSNKIMIATPMEDKKSKKK